MNYTYELHIGHIYFWTTFVACIHSTVTFHMCRETDRFSIVYVFGAVLYMDALR